MARDPGLFEQTQAQGRQSRLPFAKLRWSPNILIACLETGQGGVFGGNVINNLCRALGHKSRRRAD